VATVGAGVIGCCLALLIWLVAAPGPTGAAAAGYGGARTRAAAPGLAPPAPRAQEAAGAPVRVRVAADRDTLNACEARLEAARNGLPTVAIVGASYTAGVGPGEAAQSWAVLLARALGWNAVVDGVPGVGYVRAGAGDHGPVIRMLTRIGLSALDPALVIVQAGHDDSGVPASLERQRVGQVIAAIRAAAPRAKIALLTVFTGPSGPTAALDRTNDAIIAAALAADPGVIIMNPLAGWSYAHAHGGLHPTAAGDGWIAARVEAIVRAHGVLPAAAGAAGAAGSGPVICDSGIGGGHGVPGTHSPGDVRGKAL
jgi:lysophospholipase L1-like esterase